MILCRNCVITLVGGEESVDMILKKRPKSIKKVYCGECQKRIKLCYDLDLPSLNFLQRRNAEMKHKNNNNEDYLDAKAIEEASQTPPEEYEIVNPTHVKIKQARIDAGLTRRQLAEKMGINKSIIAKLEKPEAYPTVDILQRLAKTLGLKSYREFFNETIKEHHGNT